MKIFSVTAEMAPFCRTGGLGDVAGALPEAMTSADPGITYVSLLPLYDQVRAALESASVGLSDSGVNHSIEIAGRSLKTRWLKGPGGPRREVFFLECDDLFSGPGLYQMPDDSALSLAHRFGGFIRTVYETMNSLSDGQPDIVHLHDWHAGPLAALIRGARSQGGAPKVALTVHNLAYQGWFPKSEVDGLVEAEGDYVSFLRAGIEAADIVTTVSPQYAKEVQTEAFGCGLHQLLEDTGVHGVLNGVDASEWSPLTDPHLPANYSARDRGGKDECRRQLLALAGWAPEESGVLFGVVTRLAEQKGVDWILDSVGALEGMNARLILLGNGDPGLEAALRRAAEAQPDRLYADVRFDGPMSHRIIAGADAFLIPSRFEPCGLTQMYAMRYGTVPIVNPVGGLANTVFDHGVAANANGVHMHTADSAGLVDAMTRASALWATDRAAWRQLVDAGFAFDSSWTRSAERYCALFRSTLQTAS